MYCYGPHCNRVSLPCCNHFSGSREDSKTSESTVILQGDEEIPEKIHLLKEKMLRNIARVPVVLKKMKESILRIDNIESMTVHPALMQDRTS